MNNLKKNIDHYMKLKGIKMYSHLLVNIAHELGVKGQEAYKFANREKSNFSKMLKGERPLKYEFIIPLEKILKTLIFAQQVLQKFALLQKISKIASSF